MSKVQTVSRIAVFFLAMAVATTAVAAEKATPSGKVSIESTSIAAGIGVSLGRWEANLQRENLPVLHRRSVAGGLGHQQGERRGDVYNLTDVSKFAGNYVAAEAGFALAGGMGGMVLRNQNGVVIHLRSVSQGARLQLGPSGLKITMK